MYVDESGVEQLSDETPFYVVSGVIFYEDVLANMKTVIQQYKNDNFKNELKNAEIHLYDMYNGYNSFEGISFTKKWELINNLYDTVGELPMTIISVAIDKQKFRNWKENAKPKDVISMCYNILLERFQMFLQDQNNFGVIRIDRTTDKDQYKLNSKDQLIIKHTNNIRRKYFTAFVRAKNVVEEVLILDSSIRKGLQIADATAYCTTKYLTTRRNFSGCWNKIEPKFRRSPSGNIKGYGLVVFPR